MSDVHTLPPCERFVRETYGEDEHCPDHLHMKLLVLARQLDEHPGSVYFVLLAAIKELTQAFERITDRVQDVHSDLDWLDANLSQEYPAWYEGKGEDE